MLLKNNNIKIKLLPNFDTYAILVYKTLSLRTRRKLSTFRPSVIRKSRKNCIANLYFIFIFQAYRKAFS